MIDINSQPSRRDLKVFGWLLIIFSLGMSLFLRIQHPEGFATKIVIPTLGVITSVYWIVTPTRRAIYLAWMYAAFPIGFTVSLVLLGLIYFGLMAPMGWLRQRLSGDPLTRSWDPATASYWEDRQDADDPERYFRQF